MSITFSCPDAPRHYRVCRECMVGLPVDDIDGWIERQPFDVQQQWGCDECGFMAGISESEAPECNFANGNADDVMRMIGLPVDCCGTIKVSEIPAVARGIMRAKNISSMRFSYTSDPHEEIGAAGCHVLHFGTTDASILRRLNQLDALLAYAAKHHQDIVWG